MVVISDSDIDLKTASDNVFAHIIEEIKKSKLNYHLQQSPYSAFISPKKSFQRDRSETPVTPSSLQAYEAAFFLGHEDILYENKPLDSEVLNLHENYNLVMKELDTMRLKLTDLKDEMCIKSKKN